MDAQEFLKKLILAGSGESSLAIIKDFQEIEGGLLLTMQDNSQWRINAVCLSQNAQDETQAD